MPRGIEYRRKRAELKHARIKNIQRAISWYRRYNPTSDRWHTFFEKKNSVSETIEVPIECESHWNDFFRLYVRKLRDNPTVCSCDMCGNVRNRGMGNSSKILTIQEIKAIYETYEQLDNVETILPNTKYRGRRKVGGKY